MKHIKKLLVPSSTVLIFCLLILTGCEKSETADKETITYLHDIPEREHYASLPLMGTYWEFTGFADTRFGTVEIQSTFRRNRLTFVEDGSINGIISPNQVGGNYIAKPLNKLNISRFALVTYIGVDQNDIHYIEAMKKVSSYKISAKGLLLYYGKNTFLLFQPYRPHFLGLFR